MRPPWVIWAIVEIEESEAALDILRPERMSTPVVMMAFEATPAIEVLLALVEA